MKHTFILQVGYGDGNFAPIEEFKVICNYSFVNLKEAHEQLKNNFDIDLSSECEGENCHLTKEFVDKVAKHCGIVLDTNERIDGNRFCELYLNLAKTYLHDLEYEYVIDNCDIHNIGGLGAVVY